jgi:hypothetical protein
MWEKSLKMSRFPVFVCRCRRPKATRGLAEALGMNNFKHFQEIRKRK